MSPPGAIWNKIKEQIEEELPLQETNKFVC